MSAFQDFGPLTERRRAERDQRRRKHLMMAGASVSVVVILLVVGVAAVLYRTKNPEEPNAGAAINGAKELRSTSKAIQLMCSPTDYKQECEKSLSKAVNSTSSSSPKDLIRAAVAVIVDEVTHALSLGGVLIRSDDPRVKGAMEDCKHLLTDAKEELVRTMDGIDEHSLDQISKRSYQLKNWLSAVISYQQTCIDGFPEGDLKSKMQNGLRAAKQMTSNALAIIGKVSSFLSQFDINLDRRLLAAEPDFHDDRLPWWVSEGDRRHLKERAAKRLKPNATVAKDGSGGFTTISAALAAMPKQYQGRYTIYVKAGVYDEYVEVGKKMVNVTMYGDGSRKTIVTGSKNFVDGTRTFQTASFAAIGDGFIAEAMGFRNTAGAVKHQAVALRVQSDRSIFLNCRMEGYQDTLYAQTHFQFYRSCVIAGTVDFIFGDASAVFQNCVLVARRPLDNQQNIVTAQGRSDRQQTSGFVIHKCRVVADAELQPDKLKIRSYLGRPWKEFSRTVIMESEIGELIHPEGYMPWEGELGLSTLYYAEYNNRGPGSGLKARVKWPGFKVIGEREEAGRYTAAEFIHGGDWIKATGTPVHLGLYN